MRNAILVCLLAFMITLAVLVANRLSNEALAVATGALCGISASVPVSLALFVALSRNWGRATPEPEMTARHYASPLHTPQPPTIIFAPPQIPMSPYGYTSSSLYLPPPSNGGMPREREFKIVGEE